MISEINALLIVRNASLARDVGIRAAKLAGDAHVRVAAALIELLETLNPATTDSNPGRALDVYA